MTDFEYKSVIARLTVTNLKLLKANAHLEERLCAWELLVAEVTDDKGDDDGIEVLRRIIKELRK